MVRKVIVSQPMDERPKPVRLDSIEHFRKRLPVEVNFVLRYGMWSNGPIGHLPHKDDVDKVTRTLPGLQFGVKSLGGEALRGVVVDVRVKGLGCDCHSAAPRKMQASEKEYETEVRAIAPRLSVASLE